MASAHGSGQTPAGWYDDPSGSGQKRYWDGARWTEHYSGGSGGPAAGGTPDSTRDRIRFRSTRGGEFLAVFDGEILEIFGSVQEMGHSEGNWRFHRDLMRITIEGPDRKGDIQVRVYPDAGPDVGGWIRALTQQDRHVIDFFERVRAALPAA